MVDATFARPDLTTFTGLDALGLVVTGQLLEPSRAVLACRVIAADDWCRRCGCQGRARDTVLRRLAHQPLGWRPTTLLVSVRRYRFIECRHVWRQDTTAAAPARAKVSRARLAWALAGIVCQHLTVARVAEGLGVAWRTANDAVLAEGQRALIADPRRLDGVTAIGRRTGRATSSCGSQKVARLTLSHQAPQLLDEWNRCTNTAGETTSPGPKNAEPISSTPVPDKCRG